MGKEGDEYVVESNARASSWNERRTCCRNAWAFRDANAWTSSDNLKCASDKSVLESIIAYLKTKPSLSK